MTAEPFPLELAPLPSTRAGVVFTSTDVTSKHHDRDRDLDDHRVAQLADVFRIGLDTHRARVRPARRCRCAHRFTMWRLTLAAATMRTTRPIFVSSKRPYVVSNTESSPSVCRHACTTPEIATNTIVGAAMRENRAVTSGASCGTTRRASSVARIAMPPEPRGGRTRGGRDR